MTLFTTLRDAVVASVLAASMTATVLLPMQAASASPASPVSGASVTATTGEEEYDFLQKLNQARVGSGLAPLVSDGALAATSRSWSQTMASANLLYHASNLAAVASSVDPTWQSIGENVGVGYGVQSLHDAFMASTGHRANIMKPTYNRVGVGVVHGGGKIWVTVRFLQGAAISGPTGLEPPPPPPTPPGVRTSLTGDFDGDGYEDLLTYGPGTETDELWFGLANRGMRKVAVAVNGQYRPVAGDFDGDGRTQVLWYAPGTATDTLWEWNGSGWTSTATSISGTYKPLVGNFDGNAGDDLLWYAAGSAPDYYWYGSSTGSFSSVGTAINGSYAPLIGDLDGNGGDDVFWYAQGSAPDYVWYSTLIRGGYSSRQTAVNGTYSPFAGDFDGNGTDDLFWYAPGATADWVWFTTGTQGSYTSTGRTVNLSYLPAAGDFDGNGTDDVVWFSPSNASGDLVWFGTLGTTSYATSTVHAG